MGDVQTASCAMRQLVLNECSCVGVIFLNRTMHVDKEC